MRRISYLAIAVVVAAVSSCLKYEDSPLSDSDLGGVRLTGYTESRDTRSAVVDGGTTVYWEMEDEIKVFSGESSARFVSCNSTLDVTAEFEGPSGFSIKAGEGIAAVYPYSEDAVWDGETFTLTLPSEQVACAGTFSRGMNIAVAKSEDNSTLQFRNVGGGVRFSVKEEGVKKVIFEGLDSEAIAGKVKIGFEAGIPVVKEVTEARQFITLTAPDGKAFEVGKWYYIVAIPGALEKGYKLRFYKDDTYARLTSEKSIQVKRSVFGSVADADEGVNYEAQTTQRPITHEELKESERITQDISMSISHLIKSEKTNNETVDAQTIADAAMSIENVIYSHAETSWNGVTLLQKDSVYVIVDIDNFITDEESSEEIKEVTDISNLTTRPKLTSSNETILSNKKALLAAPFQNDGLLIKKIAYGYVNDKLITPYLEDIGYDVKFLIDDQVDIDVFSIDYLHQYDLIMIITHGCSYTKADGNPDVALTTYQKELSESSTTPYCRYVLRTTDHYYAVPGESLYSSLFKYPNSIVYIGGCHTGDYEYIPNYLYKAKASAYLGWSDEITNYYNNSTLPCLIRSLTNGASLTNSINYLEAIYTNKYDVFSVFERDGLRQFRYWMYGNDVRLFDPVPHNLQQSVKGNTVTLSWQDTPGSGESKCFVNVKGKRYTPQTNRGVTINNLAPDDYTWYVEKEIYSDGHLIETVRSGEEEFTIEGNGLERTGTLDGHAWVDLGIRKSHYDNSITPGSSADKRIVYATMNIGAKTETDEGYYFRWGEQNGWRVTGDINEDINLSSSNCIQQPKVGTSNTFASGEREIYYDDTFTPSYYLYGQEVGTDISRKINSVCNGHKYGDAATYNWGSNWHMLDNYSLMFLFHMEDIDNKTATRKIGSGANSVTVKLSFYDASDNYNNTGMPVVKIENEVLGTYIILPFVGTCKNQRRTHAGYESHYWSAVGNEDYPWTSQCRTIMLPFWGTDLGYFGEGGYYRYEGYPIRPIAEIE